MTQYTGLVQRTCVCVCVRECVRACVRACECVDVYDCGLAMGMHMPMSEYVRPEKRMFASIITQVNAEVMRGRRKKRGYATGSWRRPTCDERCRRASISEERVGQGSWKRRQSEQRFKEESQTSQRVGRDPLVIEEI